MLGHYAHTLWFVKALLPCASHYILVDLTGVRVVQSAPQHPNTHGSRHERIYHCSQYEL